MSITIERKVQSIAIERAGRPIVTVTPRAAKLEIQSVGTQGPPGAQGLTGPPGPAGAAFNYEHDQPSPLAVVTITHNLGKHPNVALADRATGARIGADVTYVNPNQLVVTMAVPIAFRAYLS